MKNITYILTLVFAITASTALAQTKSQLCDKINIDGKVYPATSITQKDNATILSFGDNVTATIPLQHPQGQQHITLGKALYVVKGTLTKELLTEAASLKELVIFGAMNNNDVKSCQGDKEGSNTIQNSDVKFINVNGVEVNSMKSFFASAPIESISFENCDFSNVTDLESFLEGCPNLKSFSFKGMGLKNDVSNLYSAFFGCTNLQSIDFSGCQFSGVTATYLFYGCPNLKEIKAIGCNQNTIYLLRKAIADNGLTNQVKLITE